MRIAVMQPYLFPYIGYFQMIKAVDKFVFYDAAHCFGVSYKGKSIFEYGDVSTCSFHATKLFHTGEGGALFSNNEELYRKLFYHHNFGHKGKEAFEGLGINAKMSELQASMGLAVFPYIDRIISSRERVVSIYMNELKDLQLLKLREGTKWNYAYFPVIFQSKIDLKRVLNALQEQNINARRYFYPSLNDLPYIKGAECPVSQDISSRIICLPLFDDLSDIDVLRICKIINQVI